MAIVGLVLVRESRYMCSYANVRFNVFSCVYMCVHLGLRTYAIVYVCQLHTGCTDAGFGLLAFSQLYSGNRILPYVRHTTLLNIRIEATRSCHMCASPLVGVYSAVCTFVHYCFYFFSAFFLSSPFREAMPGTLLNTTTIILFDGTCISLMHMHIHSHDARTSYTQCRFGCSMAI